VTVGSQEQAPGGAARSHAEDRRPVRCPRESRSGRANARRGRRCRRRRRPRRAGKTLEGEETPRAPPGEIPGRLGAEQAVEVVRNGEDGTTRLRQGRAVARGGRSVLRVRLDVSDGGGGRFEPRALEGRQTSGEEPMRLPVPSRAGGRGGRAEGPELRGRGEVHEGRPHRTRQAPGSGPGEDGRDRGREAARSKPGRRTDEPLAGSITP
jgi:hypothetical protein